MKVWIGLDNGVSGSIGIITENDTQYLKTPTKKELSYTKVKKYISRIDGNKLFGIFEQYLNDDVHVLIERPMVNPMYFLATLSAMRALEATLIIIEKCKFAYAYLDSKEWQKVLLPEGLKGPEQLKPASLEIAQRLFPKLNYKGFQDGDGLLIAEYCRRKFQ